jgi:glycosyltransferase involved in cell wall biosynthesis
MIDFIHSQGMGEFRQSLYRELRQYLDERLEQSDPANCLRLDMHCHDRNSDVPDELWGRILGLPETWLKTGKLVKCLQGNGCDVITVTNHNNARSCWELLDKGEDVLVGAEFTCHFPEYQLFVHVLAYGFTPAQEAELNHRRENIYGFLRYAAAEDIPVVLPHPMYFYTRNDRIDLELFEKMAVLFERFELVNGQRDQWQSVLTLNWIRGITPEKIRAWANKHDLEPADYGVDPDRPKALTGGSDDHMGIFAGECGTLLHVPDLAKRLKKEKPSALALEAIRASRVSPYGSVGENQRLNIALLDYFTQVATHIKDPGLLRIFFHRGETSDKLACFTISNLMLEMRKHKNTQKFYDAIHCALHGKKVKKLVKWNAKKDYRFCIDYLEQIAESRQKSPEDFMATVNRAIPELIAGLSQLIISRLEKSGLGGSKHKLSKITSEEIVRHFEIPSHLTTLIFGNKNSQPGLSSLNISTVLDSLSFPVLVSIVLLGTSMGSTRLLYQNRQFLNDFAEHIGNSHFPRRALYLTDTLRDKNGVSSSLSAKLVEIQRKDLPIDFLICHADVQPEPHLHVVRPLTSFSFPDLGEQEFRIPDFMEIARIFYEGGYDRIVCSTEGPMAIMSLMIKHMFNVPNYFFMHTDWLDFIKHNTDLNQHERDRIRRALRFFYKLYKGVFVLNTDHRQWLTGHEMQLDEDQVFLTAHYTQPCDESVKPVDKRELFPDATADTPVLLSAGRLSQEKGIFDLPEIMARVRENLPDARLVIAGTGPAEKELKEQLPEALFLGWVEKSRIRELYAGLDMFVFPSRFDTFGNVALEAFTYGMPVIAYNCKGPKDIIEDGASGYLVEDIDQMGERITAFFADGAARKAMRKRAMQRSLAYQAEPIMQRFLIDLGLADA